MKQAPTTQPSKADQAKPDIERWRQMYRQMVKIREFEERGARA